MVPLDFLILTEGERFVKITMKNTKKRISSGRESGQKAAG